MIDADARLVRVNEILESHDDRLEKTDAVLETSCCGYDYHTAYWSSLVHAVVDTPDVVVTFVLVY